MSSHQLSDRTRHSDIHSFLKPQRSHHIHSCVQRKLACCLDVPKSQLKYCYECFTWCHENEWNQHCEEHMPSMTSLHCEVIVYRHTIVRPGYCPWCMWDDRLKAGDRMRPWLQSNKLKDHIHLHIQKMQWPAPCLHHSCEHLLDNEQACCCHLHDMHGFHNSIWQRTKGSGKSHDTYEYSEDMGAQKAQESQHRHCRNLKRHSSTTGTERPKTFWIIAWDPASHEVATQLAMTSQNPPMVSSEQSNLQQPTSEVDDCSNIHYFNCVIPPSLEPSISSGSILSGSSSILDLTNPLTTLSPSALGGDSPNLIPIDLQILEGKCSSSSFHNPKCNEDSCETISHDQTPASIWSGQVVAGTPPREETNPNTDSLASTTSLSPSEAELPNDFMQCTTLPEDSTKTCGLMSRPHHRSCERAAVHKVFVPPGPVTRAKAREQAVRLVVKNVAAPQFSQRSRSYIAKEDQLLCKLMRQNLTHEKVTEEFQKQFPDRTVASIQRCLAIIQPSLPPLTRSKSKRCRA